MGKQIDFYFDFGSPASYLAWTQLPAIAEKAGATLHYHPFLLGGVFQATKNHSPNEILSKSAWAKADLARFGLRYGVPFAHNPYFPVNTLHLMRGAIGYQMFKPEQFEVYVRAIYHAMWVESLNLGDQNVLGALLVREGFDITEFLHFIAHPEVKEKLRQETEIAVQRGAFGAPTMFVNDEMHFGQDRLDFVREALSN